MIPKHFDVYYDPFTERVHVIDSVDKLQKIADKILNEVHTLRNCAKKLEK